METNILIFFIMHSVDDNVVCGQVPSEEQNRLTIAALIKSYWVVLCWRLVAGQETNSSHKQKHNKNVSW